MTLTPRSSASPCTGSLALDNRLAALQAPIHPQAHRGPSVLGSEEADIASFSPGDPMQVSSGG